MQKIRKLSKPYTVQKQKQQGCAFRSGRNAGKKSDRSNKDYIAKLISLLLYKFFHICSFYSYYCTKYITRFLIETIQPNISLRAWSSTIIIIDLQFMTHLEELFIPPILIVFQTAILANFFAHNGL